MPPARVFRVYEGSLLESGSKKANQLIEEYLKNQAVTKQKETLID